MEHYTYAGKPLKIAHTADMQLGMWPNRRYAKLVQQLLDAIEPWDPGDDPIETMEFNKPILPMAVPVDGGSVVWGIHRSHKARSPDLSPFVNRRVPRALMGSITVELVGPVESPLLVRAYGGEYTPPLPWMASAGNALDGLLGCQKYWQSHAYLMGDFTSICEGTMTTTPPEWFTRLS